MSLRVNGITKIFDGHTVVDSVSFDINHSDYVAIIGPSGSGKTTLLSMLTGMLQPNSGEINFNDRKLSKMSNHELSRFRSMDLGLVFQFSELIGNLTVEENILLPALFTKKFSKESYKNSCSYLLEKLRLEDLANKLPRTLSGGQIQKVAFARALINEPEILLADEPSSDLDPENSSHVRELLSDYNAKGLTILLVTHDMKLAFDAKTIYEMRAGKFSRVIK